ncbi:unnamed protein product [Colias eurytheme]|nr:unnamed protein product [Colias eurytheme]
MSLCAFTIETCVRTARGRERSKAPTSTGACVGSRSSSAPPSGRGLLSSAFRIDRRESRIVRNANARIAIEFQLDNVEIAPELCRNNSRRDMTFGK